MLSPNLSLPNSKFKDVICYDEWASLRFADIASEVFSKAGQENPIALDDVDYASNPTVTTILSKRLPPRLGLISSVPNSSLHLLPPT